MHLESKVISFGAFPTSEVLVRKEERVAPAPADGVLILDDVLQQRLQQQPALLEGGVLPYLQQVCLCSGVTACPAQGKQARMGADAGLPTLAAIRALSILALTYVMQNNVRHCLGSDL